MVQAEDINLGIINKQVEFQTLRWANDRSVDKDDVQVSPH